MFLRSLTYLGAVALSALAADPFTGVGIRIGDETVPPGGVAQIKIYLTEPKPIPTGRFDLSFESWAMADVLGVAVTSAAGDASCAMVRTGAALSIRCSSPQGSLGMLPDYPVITIAIRVPATAPVGATSVLQMSGTSFFTDLTGLPYPTEFKPGSIRIAPGANIHNVRPGGGPLQAGQFFEIVGEGFTPDMRVQVEDVPLIGYAVLSPNRAVAAPAAATDLTGKRVRLRSGNVRPVYYSYLRAFAVPATQVPLLLRSEAMFAAPMVRLARLNGIQADASKPMRFTAVAVQNPSQTPAIVAFDLLAPNGTVAATRSMAIAGYRKLMCEVHELFPGIQPQPGRALRIRSTQGIQVFGAQGDSTTNELLPVTLN